MSIGFREFNSYLIIFQLYFQFMNDYNDIMNKLNKKEHHNNNYENIEEKELSLEQILSNENLLQKKDFKSKNLWKRGIIKAIDRTKRYDVFYMSNEFKFKKIEINFVDNLLEMD